MTSFTVAIAAGIVITMLLLVAPGAMGVFINHKNLDDWRKFDWKRFWIAAAITATINTVGLIHLTHSLSRQQ